MNQGKVVPSILHIIVREDDNMMLKEKKWI
jgi:hypothetical protein